eukprot:TRINITY_DN1519_c0_g1_i1.p1 TRINITY_DN1519_c0_g1~~TRINITY_DN1519_c0_g1_i1.p1  ORF type:complete len:200 (+),score=24.98 TRINITY_DN1519_c0_g1_i1:390-989(+)
MKSLFDLCVSMRTLNPDTLGTAVIPQFYRDLFGFWIVRALLFGLLLMCVRATRHGKRVVAVILLLMVLSYLPLLFMVETLKRSIADTACHTMNNAVSGHTFYHSFVVSMTVYMAMAFDRARRRVTHLPRFVCLLAIACVLPQTITTWTYGYHSVRQMVLGACLGFICVGIVVSAADTLMMQLQSRFFTGRQQTRRKTRK